jgi:alanyl-tRNA synthetase
LNGFSSRILAAGVSSDRLYYTDCYLRSFRARVIGSAGPTIYLDRTAFYPTSGGQPHDTGTVAGVAVQEVVEEGERIAHRLATPLSATEVDCEVDWPRRFDHMQQHTGQHLLSAVFAELFGWQTVSFHLGGVASTIDLATPSAERRHIEEAERRANEMLAENRTVSIAFEDSASAQGLRKETQRAGSIRIVAIEGLDRSACGGTHVRRTGEIGCILLRGLDKVRGIVRVEFLCGGRAVSRARSDYNALASIARSLSAAIDETPLLVQTNLVRLEESDKSRRKLAMEVAAARGRSQYDECETGESGFRVVRKQGALNDETRAEAQAFAARPRAVYIAWQESPMSVLAVCSADAGHHAGNVLKEVMGLRGGRGGGSATLAQASVPANVSVREIVDELASRLTAG